MPVGEANPWVILLVCFYRSPSTSLLCWKMKLVPTRHFPNGGVLRVLFYIHNSINCSHAVDGFVQDHLSGHTVHHFNPTWYTQKHSFTETHTILFDTLETFFSTRGANVMHRLTSSPLAASRWYLCHVRWPELHQMWCTMQKRSTHCKVWCKVTISTIIW